MGIPMNNYLVVTALGADSSDIVNQFTQNLANCGGNILNTRMTTLGSEFAIMVLIEGSWGAIAKIETSLPAIENHLGLITSIRRTTPRNTSQKTMTYVVHVVTIDRTAILTDLSQFFSTQDINIEDVSAHTYYAHTGTRMVAITMNINISVNVHLPTLREQFMTYCDALNLDAGMEPLRD